MNKVLRASSWNPRLVSLLDRRGKKQVFAKEGNPNENNTIRIY